MTRPWLGYNVARLGLLVAAIALGYVAGLRGPLLLIAALLVSGVFSYFLLSRQRTAMAVALTRAVDHHRQRAVERTAREDAAAEAWHGSRPVQ